MPCNQVQVTDLGDSPGYYNKRLSQSHPFRLIDVQCCMLIKSSVTMTVSVQHVLVNPLLRIWPQCFVICGIVGPTDLKICVPLILSYGRSCNSVHLYRVRTGELTHFVVPNFKAS